MSKGKKKRANLDYFKHTARGKLVEAFGWYYVEGEVVFVSIKNGRRQKIKNQSPIGVTDRILDVDFLKSVVGRTVKYEYRVETVWGVKIGESFSIKVLDLPKNKKTSARLIKKTPKTKRSNSDDAVARLFSRTSRLRL